MDAIACKHFRTDLEAALKQIGSKYGMNFSVGTIRYGIGDLRCKVQGLAAGKVGGATAPTVEMTRLLSYLKSPYTPSLLKAIDVTKMYVMPNVGPVKIVGYVPRRPKYPFLVKCVGGKGKQYKVPQHMVEAAVRNGGK